jgi:hypothetical protein
MEIMNMTADALYYADKLVSDYHRGRNCPLSPAIPFKNVDISAADRRAENSDQNIEFANLWDWNLVQPKTGCALFLDERFHRLHTGKINAENSFKRGIKQEAGGSDQ